MKKAIRFIIPGIILLAAAGIIIANFLSNRIPSNSPDTIGNTAGNLNSGGIFCEIDGTIFFSNPYDGGRLYSMKSDCTDIRYVSGDKASCINAAGQFVYYIKNNGTSDDITVIFRSDLFGIVRCRTDGSDSDTLVSGYSTDLSLTGNTLVYNENDGTEATTSSIDIRGENQKTVSRRNCSTASVMDGTVYYSNSGDNHSVYSLDLDDSTISLYMDGNTYMANMVGNELYYIDLDNGSALTKVNLDTYEQYVLSEDECTLYNVYNNIVYYSVGGDNPSLKRMNTDGTDKTTVMEGSISTISCTSQYTFFQLEGDETLYRTETYNGTGIQIFYIQPQNDMP